MGEVQHRSKRSGGRNEYRCEPEMFPIEMYMALDLKDPLSIHPIKEKRRKSSYSLIKTFSERNYQTANRQKEKNPIYLQPHSSNAECQRGHLPACWEMTPAYTRACKPAASRKAEDSR